MPLAVRAATRADIPAIVDVCAAAFLHDPVFRYMYAGAAQAESYGFIGEEWDLPGCRCFVLVDEGDGDGDADSGKVVAFARWYYPYDLTAEQEAAGVGEDSADGPAPAGAVESLYREFFTKLFAGRKRLANHSKTYVLDILAVHPDHQRRGLGTFLIRHGLDIADRHGMKTYLESTKKGLGLYERLGWKAIDEMMVDTTPYGREGVEVTKFMMRDPRPI